MVQVLDFTLFEFNHMGGVLTQTQVEDSCLNDLSVGRSFYIFKTWICSKYGKQFERHKWNHKLWESIKMSEIWEGGREPKNPKRVQIR